MGDRSGQLGGQEREAMQGKIQEPGKELNIFLKLIFILSLAANASLCHPKVPVKLTRAGTA